MTIMERGRRLVQWVRGRERQTPWEERQCPHCHGHDTGKHGSDPRQPWTREGRQPVRLPRYRCRPCRRTFTPDPAVVERRRWYGRDVRRGAIDRWQHGGRSVRRTAQWLRSLVGGQERWQRWRPWTAPPPTPDRCRLSASTVQR
jgi:hypothetical protein